MSSGKAICEGDIAIELYKLLAREPGDYLQGLLDLMNECFEMQRVPDAWLRSVSQ